MIGGHYDNTQIFAHRLHVMCTTSILSEIQPLAAQPLALSVSCMGYRMSSILGEEPVSENNIHELGNCRSKINYVSSPALLATGARVYTERVRAAAYTSI